MNKKQIYLIGVIIIVIAIALMFLLQGINKNKSEVKLNKTQIECYEAILYFLRVDSNITHSQLNVQTVRCSQSYPDNYYQTELTGTYFEDENHELPPKSIYYQRIAGGMAASGQDSYEEVCLVIGNQTTISEIKVGREMNSVGRARCSWQTKLP